MISGFLNGALGAGGGTVVVPALERFLGVDEHKAHATAISIILPITMVSSFFYLRQGMLDLKTTTAVAVSGVLGGVLGAGSLKRLSGKALRMVFAVSMIIAGVRMLWG